MGLFGRKQEEAKNTKDAAAAAIITKEDAEKNIEKSDTKLEDPAGLTHAAEKPIVKDDSKDSTEKVPDQKDETPGSEKEAEKEESVTEIDSDKGINNKSDTKTFIAFMRFGKEAGWNLFRKHYNDRASLERLIKKSFNPEKVLIVQVSLPE